MKNFESMTDAMADLKSRGYEASFEPQPFCLYCGDLDIRLDAQDFSIDETYHFKTGTGDGVMMVLYAVSSITGVKGTLIDNSADSVENLNADIARKLREHSSR